MRHNRIAAGFLAVSLMAGLLGCSPQEDRFTPDQKGATETTIEKNEEVYRQLDFNDKEEINSAARGLLDSPESLEIKDEDGNVVWSQDAFSFITEETPSPDTVHPGLWSNAQMNRYYGLFQVHDRIFQVRGYDVTNLTLIAGDTGWIIVDPMSNEEAMRAALELVEKDIEQRPIVGVIYTSPSSSHYGGVAPLMEDLTDPIPIIAPQGFLDAAGTEGLFTENLTRRYSEYLYGSLLPSGAQGNMLVGQSENIYHGTVTYYSPKDFITETGETRVIDGVEIEFQLAQDTTGAAAMNLYFPQFQCLWLAENCGGTLHDLYQVTGETAVQPDQWADFLKETYVRYGAEAEIVIEAHNWPHWENSVVSSYLSDQAAAYQYVYDQTISLMNQGYEEAEIIQRLSLPDNLAKRWYLRQFCASLSGCIRQVYSAYEPLLSANPVDLNPLTDSEAAQHLVEYLGDPNAVLEKAQEDFEQGEYQWVAQITNVLIEADPNNLQARYLCADALEQLGYQCESVFQRNLYLTGAKELREGVDPQETELNSLGFKAQYFMSGEAILNYMGTLIDPNLAQGKELTFLLELTDDDALYTVQLKNSVLLVYPGETDPSCENKLTTTSVGLFAILNQEEKLQNLLIKTEGDQSIVSTLASCLNRPSGNFNIVTP